LHKARHTSFVIAHILEGSVRKAGNQVRITAQLIDARSDSHLWSETYNRNVLDVFADQDEIEGEISRQLELTLVSSSRPGRPTENEKAYDHYLRGISFHHQYKFLKVRDHFQAAIALEDETRPVSKGYLAAVYANLGENDLAMESLARAVEEYDSWIWNLDYPMWDAIRSDPRFIELCEGLEMACAEQYADQ